MQRRFVVFAFVNSFSSTSSDWKLIKNEMKINSKFETESRLTGEKKKSKHCSTSPHNKNSYAMSIEKWENRIRSESLFIAPSTPTAFSFVQFRVLWAILHMRAFSTKILRVVGACKSRSFIKTAITVLLIYEIGHGFLESLFDFAKNEPEIDSPRWKDFVIHCFGDFFFVFDGVQ